MAVSQRVRFEVLKRDGFRCVYCGATANDAQLHVDHIIPSSRGGSDDPANLVTSCDRCNLGKSNVHLHESHPSMVPLDEAVSRAEDAAALANAQADRARMVDAMVGRAMEMWSHIVGGRTPRTVEGALPRLVIEESPEHLAQGMEAVARKRDLTYSGKARYFFGVLRRLREQREAESLTIEERHRRRQQLHEKGIDAYNRGAYEEAASHLLASRNLAFDVQAAFMEGLACFEVGWFDRALHLFQRTADSAAKWESLFNAALCAERLGSADLAISLATQVAIGASDQPRLMRTAADIVGRLVREEAEAADRAQRAADEAADRQRRWSELRARTSRMKAEGRTLKEDVFDAVRASVAASDSAVVSAIARSEDLVRVQALWGATPSAVAGYVGQALAHLGWKRVGWTSGRHRSRLWAPLGDEEE